MRLKRIILMLCLILNAAFVCAQGRFDPNKVRQETHKFITKEANLSAQEASRFFLIYDKMRSKQRVYFDRLRTLHNTKPKSAREASDIITKSDMLEIQLKHIEQRYHVEMLKVIPAEKLLQILEAERRFHRQVFRKMAGEGKGRR